MKYFSADKLSLKTLTGLPVPCVLFFAALFMFLLPGAPRSSAAKTPEASASAGVQEIPEISFSALYHQTNLVSDQPGVALVRDRSLQSPWGIALNATSPFWVVNNEGDSATLYKGDVAGGPLVPNASMPLVAIPNIPTVAAAPSQPTGVVANGTNDFAVSLTPTSPATPAQFIFVTLNGGINAWQPAFGATAVSVKFMSGHRYTGLAAGSNAAGNLLYAADFASGAIDVFDKNFNLTSVSGNFADAGIPANFHPYNIQNLGGALYVAYAQFEIGLNFDTGFVRKFNTDGVRDMAFAINNGPLNAPWGMALAPPNSGPISNNLLVGNNQTGAGSSINAFNPATGSFFGVLTDGGGGNLQINDLRGLTFGNGVNGGDANTLYFTAGNARSHFGLLGSLRPITAPAATVSFSATEYHTTENAGHFDVTVTRTSSTAGAASVNYATVDGGATQKSDYEIALGKLTFDPGESSKTFRVLIVDDKLVGGGSAVDLNLVLTNPAGAELAQPSHATLFIMDDEFDTPGQPPNINDDAQSFVRQQYFDFLNREPDSAGFNFWTNQITSCGTDQQCIALKRINVSAAFFLSIEFQKTGMIAYLAETLASGSLPQYGNFMRDVQALQKDFVVGNADANAQLERNKQAFFDEFVTRPEFVAKYGKLSNSDYAAAIAPATTGELYIAKLTGAQTVPPAGSPATGLVIFRQAISGPGLSVTLYLNGLSSAQTAAHIHGPAAANANGALILTLPNGQLVDFPTTFTNSQFVDLSGGLLYVDVHTANFPDGEIRAQLPPNRFVKDMLLQSLDAGIITRAQAFRLAVESELFRTNEFNRAFVLMEYFGYLRRNPNDLPDHDLSGFNFWLAKLNQFNGNFVKADMVKAFIESTEYRRRFGAP